MLHNRWGSRIDVYLQVSSFFFWDWANLFFTAAAWDGRTIYRDDTTLYWILNFKACINTHCNHDIHTHLFGYTKQAIVKAQMHGYAVECFFKSVSLSSHTTMPHINKGKRLGSTIFLVQRSIRCSPAWDSRIYNVTMWVMRSPPIVLLHYPDNQNLA